MAREIADDEHVDVATDVLIAARVGAEQERVAHLRLESERAKQLGDEPDRACVQVAQGWEQRIRRVHPPHAQRTDAAALDEPLAKQLLESKLDGTRIAFDPPHELARVELLSGRRREERQQARFCRRPSDFRHLPHDTSVFTIDTSVSCD